MTYQDEWVATGDTSSGEIDADVLELYGLLTDVYDAAKSGQFTRPAETTDTKGQADGR